MTAKEISTALGISQPTVSRLLGSTTGIVRIGRARATRYALAREIGRQGNRWPLFRILADGRAEILGQLRALYGDQFLFEPQNPEPALLQGEFTDGLFPGLPWFLDDLRPQGFLGRALAHRIADEIGAPNDLARWQADDVLLAILRHGDDLPGNLVLGEPALQRAQAAICSRASAFDPELRVVRYPALAEAALQGELVGSSAGGEQPKFTAQLRVQEGVRAVIVKFSEPGDSGAAQRWADLLRAEHLAATLLADNGLDAARTELLRADGRVFLESTRFDRTSRGGRHGFVSLAALDAAFHGHGRIDWWIYAEQLQRESWLSAEDARRLRLIGWFGELIGNADMHLGNAGLIPQDTRPWRLAPAYDMLPMALRPSASGEVVERRLSVTLPTPQQLADWQPAAMLAQQFWQAVADDQHSSNGFRRIASEIEADLARAMSLVDQSQASSS